MRRIAVVALALSGCAARQGGECAEGYVAISDWSCTHIGVPFVVALAALFGAVWWWWRVAAFMAAVEKRLARVDENIEKLSRD